MQLVGERTDVPVPPRCGSSSTRRARRAVLRDGAGRRRVPPDVMPYNFGQLAARGRPRGPGDAAAQRVAVLAGIHAIERPRTEVAFLELDLPATPPCAACGRPARLLRLGARRDPVPAHRARRSRGSRTTGRRRGPAVISWATPASATCCSTTSSRSPCSTGRWRRSRPARSTSVDDLHPPFFEDIASRRASRGCRGFLTATTSPTTYAEMTGYEPLDLEWFIAYSAIRHGVVMRRVTEHPARR